MTQCVLVPALLMVFGCAPKSETIGTRIIPVDTPERPPTANTVQNDSVSQAPSYYRQGRWQSDAILRPPMQKWKVQTQGPIVHPLILSGTSLYAVAGGVVSKIKTNGQVVWANDLAADGPVTPADEGILVPTVTGTMQVVDPATGTIINSYGGFSSIRSPALPHAQTLAWVERDGILITANTQNGPYILGPVSDAASDGDHYIFGNIHQEVVCIRDFETAWTAQVPGPITGHPVIGQHVVFVSFAPGDSGPGGVAALDLANGSVKWLSHIGPAASAPISLGEFLVMATRTGELVALDPVHGRTRWSAPSPTMHTTKPAIVGDSIYIGDGMGRLHRYDMADGGRVWSVDLNAPITGDLVFTDDLIIVGTSDGFVVALSQ